MKSLSQSCSVSVIILERPLIIVTAEQMKASLQMLSMDKRKRNSISLSNIDNDDYGDNDYANGNQDGDDSNNLPRP